MKISFKYSGSISVANPYKVIHIKEDKKLVGYIIPPNFMRENFSINVSVKNDNEESNCPFKWIKLKAEFSNENDAKTFIKDNWTNITSKYKIYKHDS